MLIHKNLSWTDFSVTYWVIQDNWHASNQYIFVFAFVFGFGFGFGFSRQGFSVQLQLSSNSLGRPGWPNQYILIY